MVKAAGRWLGRRFRSAYSRHAAVEVDPGVLRWFEGAVGRPVGEAESCIGSRQLVTFDPGGDLGAVPDVR